MSDDFLDEPRHSVVFWTGLSVDSLSPADNYFDKKENATWLAGLQQQGFQRLVQWCPRLWKLRYVDDLLKYTSLEEQSREMADWVLEPFRVAAASPPPIADRRVVSGGAIPALAAPSSDAEADEGARDSS